MDTMSAPSNALVVASHLPTLLPILALHCCHCSNSSSNTHGWMVLNRGGGGAALAVTTAIASSPPSLTRTSATKLRSAKKETRGIQTSRQDRSHSQGPTSAVVGNTLDAQCRAAIFMALAMALHYVGYSLARPVSVALFTSSSSGFGGLMSAFPMSVTLTTPIVMALLTWYGTILNQDGPRHALAMTTKYSVLFLAVCSAAIAIFSKTGWMIGSIPVVKLVSAPLFLFRESYVQLLTSQYWSFIVSILRPSTAMQWFGPIAALSSIGSALGALAVSPLIHQLGLSGTLLVTVVALLLSFWAMSVAYNLATTNGFEPMDVSKVLDTQKGKSPQNKNLLPRAIQTIVKTPVLGALLKEVLVCQSLLALLGVCFVAQLSASISGDTDRLGKMSSFFFTTNVWTALIQLVILPGIFLIVEPKFLWRIVPLLTLLCVITQAFNPQPTLSTVGTSLMVMKVSEFSVRHVLDQLIFVPLDFDSCYIAKQMIDVWGFRMGKTVISVALTALTALLGTIGLQQLSWLAVVMAVLWTWACWNLSHFVPSKQEAENEYIKTQQKTAAELRMALSLVWVKSTWESLNKNPFEIRKTTEKHFVSTRQLIKTAMERRRIEELKMIKDNDE